MLSSVIKVKFKLAFKLNMTSMPGPGGVAEFMNQEVTTKLMDRVSSGVPVIHSHFSPVHILGHGRSGTSIFSAICRVYLGIGIGTESQFILRFKKCSRRLRRLTSNANDKNLRDVVEAILSEKYFNRIQKFDVAITADLVLDRLEVRTYEGILDAIFTEVARQMGYRRWGDKSPEYVANLPALLQMFPESQFIHIVRDGRDVALSAFEQPLSGIKNVFRAAVDWRDAVAKIQAFEKTLPSGRFLTIKYETLLDNPRNVLRLVIDFLRIKDDSGELLNFAEGQVKRELKAGNHTKWKHRMSSKQVRCFDRIAGDLLSAYGYESSSEMAHEPKVVESVLANVANTLCQWSYPEYWSLNLQRVLVRLYDLKP